MAMRALIADFGGVLTLDFYEVLRDFARREGLHADALVELITVDPTGKRLLAAVEAGDITQAQFQAELGPRLGVEAEDMVARVFGTVEPDAAMVAATSRLREHGVPCAILSNSWGIEPFNPYTPWLLEQHWDVVVYSHEVRLRKPSTEIYLLTAERLGVAPSACVFIDDTAHNLPEAEQLGMTVIHHKDSETTIRRLEALFAVDLTHQTTEVDW